MKEVEGIDKAKKIFWQFGGDTFQMFREGIFDEYKKYNISKITESLWLREYLNEMLDGVKNAPDFETFYRKYLVAIEYAVKLEDIILFKKLRDDTKTLSNEVPEFYILVIMEQLFKRCSKFRSEIESTAKVILNVIGKILSSPIKNSYKRMLASGEEMEITTEEIRIRCESLIKDCTNILNG